MVIQVSNVTFSEEKNRKRSVPISGLKINADLDLALVELSIPVKEMKIFSVDFCFHNFS